MTSRGVMWIVVGLVMLCAGLTVFALGSSGQPAPPPRLTCIEVDVVYTWVNGSDPVHVAALRKHSRTQDKREAAPKLNAGKERADEESRAEAGRYRDYDVLRYSMRSVHSLFPLARRIHLVIADDEALPSWLDASDERVRIVRHSAIMPASALPTFNSNAIETNLHKVPGVAECFVYLNDDMLFARLQPSLDYYWDAARGVQRVHFGSWVAPMADERLDNNKWHASIAASNARLDKLYGTAARPYPLHGCYFFHRTTFAKMRELLAPSFDKTLHEKFRSDRDNVVSFLYPHVAMREYGAVEGTYQLYYAALRPDPRENLEALRHLVRRRPLCSCINDALGDGGPEEAAASVGQLREALELLLPHSAPWERPVSPLPPFDRSRYEGNQGVELFLKMLVGVPVLLLTAAATVALALLLLRKCTNYS